MGAIRVVQGAALSDRYRALVLARGLKAALKVRVSTPGGLAGERVALRAVTPPKVAPHLRARGLSAALLDATALRAGRVYRFDMEDGKGTSAFIETYTLPGALPAGGLTFAVGSCFYEGFGKAARIDNALRSTLLDARPLFQFWVGDNLYVDVPAFGLFAGNAPYEQTLDRYLQYFDDTAYARARSLTPNYTAYDDHEFWNNYPEPQTWLSRTSGAQREGYARAALDCLDLFQSRLNPDPVPGGRSFRFELPPLSFFFVDLRSNRTRHDGGSGLMMTAGELAALIDWARHLTGPGVLVVGQPLWMHGGGATDYNPPDFRPEYEAIWAALKAAPYDILIVSGDVHHSRLLELADTGGRFVYEFVSSPASHIPTVVTTVLPWKKQAKSSVSVPTVGDGSASRLKPRYFFGTGAANTIGLLRFAAKGSAGVEVSAAFVDYTDSPTPVFARCDPVSGMPLARQQFKTCAGRGLFTLRRRTAQ